MFSHWPRSVQTKALLSLLILLSVGPALGTSQAFAYSERQFQEVTTSQEEEISRVRDQEINQIKIVLGRRFEESRKPELLLRLAELYIERYRHYFLKENEIHQKLYKEGKRPKKVEHARSQEQLKLSLSACQAILKSKVHFSKMDQVYYFMGFNFQELGKKKDALQNYGVVTKRFSNSPYAAEAFRNLAESAFENKKYADSVKLYESAARFKNVPSYPRTLYKLSWAYFKTRHYADALKTMKSVVNMSSSEQFVGLREEALNDLVGIYAEAGKWSEAKEYFSKISGGPELYVKSLAKLSKIYEKRGDYKLALRVNRSLIEEHGDGDPSLIFSILARNVALNGKLGDKDSERDSITKLVAFYKKHPSAVEKDEEGKALFIKIKNFARARATETHKLAQKKKSKTYYSQAADFYQDYLKTFLSDPTNASEEKEVQELQFYRTDCLLSSGRDLEASEELQVVFNNTSFVASKRREAGASLLKLLSEKLKKEDAQEKFIQVSLKFEEAFPKDFLNAELQYKRAKIESARSPKDTGLSSKAVGEFEAFIAKYPSKKESVELSRELVSDALLKKKDEQLSISLAKKFLKLDPKYFETIVARGRFSEAQRLEKESNFEGAAGSYEALANAAKDKEVFIKSLYNAAVNYEKAGKVGDAFRVYEKLSSRLDLKRLAGTLLWSSRFGEAAGYYAKLRSFHAFNQTEKWDFFWTAYFLYEGIGEKAASDKLSQDWIKESCKPWSSECHDVFLNLARSKFESGHLMEASHILQNYKKLAGPKTKKAEVGFLTFEICKKRNELKAAQQALVSAAVKGSKDIREKNFAAHAAFILVEPYFLRFRAIKLEQTKKKLSELEGLVSRYQAVVNFGDSEWAIAALERIADAFLIFSKELEKAPAPPKLKPAELEIYKREISQISTKMAERAYEFLKKGYDQGLSLEVTTPTFITLTQKLSRLKPTHFPPAHYSLGTTKKEETAFQFAGGSSSREQIAQALKQNPKNDSVWVQFGNLEASEGKLKLAKFFYDQAISLNSKNAAAVHNIAAISLLEHESVQAVQSFKKAYLLVQSDRLFSFHYARVLSAYHHYPKALKVLKPFEQETQSESRVGSVYAAALLGSGGSGQAKQALKILESLGGDDSQVFSLWYNWCVAALNSGEAGKKESAIKLLKEKLSSSELTSLEKAYVEIALGN